MRAMRDSAFRAILFDMLFRAIYYAYADSHVFIDATPFFHACRDIYYAATPC